MKQDDILPVMPSEECSRRIRRALRAELDKRWGERAAISVAIGRDAKHLYKVCRGELPLKLDDLLLALEVMAVDAGRFFVNALGTPVENDLLLADLERFGEVHEQLRAIEKATVELELSEAASPAPPPVDVDALLAELVACNVTEERRRLKTARRYCHPAFAAVYLEHLDALRYDDPRVARKNAWVVAVRLIPRLPGPRRERMAIQIKAIGVFASSHRQKEDSATAACALRFALSLARAHGLKETAAELLQRGAYVLSGVGRYIDAMKLLDEALVIFFDLDSQAGLARVLVDRGTHLYYLGEYHGAVAALEHALNLSTDESARSSRNCLVAHQVLGRCFHSQGDLKRAEAAIGEAVAHSGNAGALYRASLLWDHGVVALECLSYDLAEERLRAASQLFAQLKDSTQALVALDLIKTLAVQGKAFEAIGLAATTADYLATFRGNRVADAAVSALMRTVAKGRVSLDLIERVQEKLEAERDRMSRSLPQVPQLSQRPR